MGLSINTGTEKLEKIYKRMKGVLQMCSEKMIFLWHFPLKKSSRPFYSSLLPWLRHRWLPSSPNGKSLATCWDWSPLTPPLCPWTLWTPRLPDVVLKCFSSHVTSLLSSVTTVKTTCLMALALWTLPPLPSTPSCQMWYSLPTRHFKSSLKSHYELW